MEWQGLELCDLYRSHPTQTVTEKDVLLEERIIWECGGVVSHAEPWVQSRASHKVVLDLRQILEKGEIMRPGC